jgi:hypothetical protein
LLFSDGASGILLRRAARETHGSCFDRWETYLSDTLDPELRRKLSPEARAWVDGRGPSAFRDKPMAAFVVFNTPPKPADLDRLRAEGVEIGTLAGEVMTARVPREALPKILEDPNCRYVEMSRPMQTE